jgi:hypothetical protein
MNKLFKYISFGLLWAALLLIALCGCSGAADTSNNTTTPAADAGYQIKITLKDGQITYLGLPELQTLPTVQMEAYGKSEEGPTFLSALELAGVSDFSKVTISGMLRGRVATGEITLSRAEVTEDVILDFSNRGTTKLAGPEIPEDNWIIDVAEISIE